MRSAGRVAAAAAASTLALAPSVLCLSITINDTDSIKSAASTVAYGMVKYYSGNNTGDTPGMLPGPYYWWEAGAMFNSLVNYWYYTGDTTYNAITKQALLFQKGSDNNYMPVNETKNEGNDDQVFWGFAVMSAAEYNFENPDAGDPGWLALAQGVFNSQAARWDAADCGGGLRWQIFTWNNGYNYKNSPSNGGLFNMAARLGAYTGNQTYFDWAAKIWDWMHDTVGLIGDDYEVYDGTSISDNCTSLDHTRWTYTQGMLLHGAAVMWNQTNSTTWRDRTQGLWNASSVFFDEQKVMFEVCEASDNCNLDEQSFKAYLSRFLAASTKVAPWLHDQVTPYLEASALAAAQQCSGGSDAASCGLAWTRTASWDGHAGVGEQMAALEVIQATLIHDAAAPVAANSGGTSQGDPSAGTGDDGGGDAGPPLTALTAADRAGAGILTALVCLSVVSGGWWLVA